MLVHWNLNLELNQKGKENLSKIRKRKWKINIEKKIEMMKGEMSILSEILRKKDPKPRKARNVKRKYKITNVYDIRKTELW